MGDTDPEFPEPPRTDSERIDALHKLVVRMAADLLHVRQVVDPVGLRTRLLILAGSAFAGGAITDAILWLLNVEPLFHRLRGG